MITKDLGVVTAYAYAVEGGYTGTEAEFEALLANVAIDLSEIENLTVTVTTLPAGSSATASYSHGVLSLGIPKGDKGDIGATGPTGNGISSITKTGTAGSVDTYTITYTNGNTTTFEVTNGEVTEAQLAGIIATEYDSTKTYAVGDFCLHNGVLYECTTAITTAEAWNSAHWTLANVGEEINALDEQVDELRTAITQLDYSKSVAVAGTRDWNVVNGVLTIVSYAKAIYAPISNLAETVTISKAQGKMFCVAFTTVRPDRNVSVIGYVDKGEATEAIVAIPNNATYVVAIVWNSNTDTTSAADMLASITIKENYGAITKINSEIEAINNNISNIPPQNLTAITRTGWNYVTDAIVKEVGKYWNGNTIGQDIILGENASYCAVKIKADETVYNFTSVRFLHALDANQNLLQVITTSGTNSFDNTTLKASYLCFTFYASDYATAFIQKVDEEPFEQYTITGKWIFDEVTQSTYKPTSVQTAENYISDFKQSLKKGIAISYFSTFDVFTSLMIGLTTTNTYSTGYIDYFEITNENLILHRPGREDGVWTHGLIFSDYISVQIIVNYGGAVALRIYTNGGSYNVTNYFYLTAQYYPFAVITGTGVANNKLSISCTDFWKNIVIFGDSYLSDGALRWLYYVPEETLNNLCLNGYPGEASTQAIVDCLTLFKFITPKYAVWTLGMNDGSDTNDTTPSTQWLTNVQTFINACGKQNIVPILATIPSIPTSNNRAKSAWVRSSGYRYIDFASAVNNGNDGSWYTNMLYQDGVHPDTEGAKALCERVLTDFPEILIPS